VPSVISSSTRDIDAARLYFSFWRMRVQNFARPHQDVDKKVVNNKTVSFAVNFGCSSSVHEQHWCSALCILHLFSTSLLDKDGDVTRTCMPAELLDLHWLQRESRLNFVSGPLPEPLLRVEDQQGGGEDSIAFFDFVVRRPCCGPSSRPWRPPKFE